MRSRTTRSDQRSPSSSSEMLTGHPDRRRAARAPGALEGVRAIHLQCASYIEPPQPLPPSGTLALVNAAAWRRSAVALLAATIGCGPTAPTTPASLKVPLGDSPQRGPADAWVTLVEFADFECPFCRGEEPVVRDLASIYGADLRVVFKHLPLTSLHPHAQAAAVAAVCAGDQGKFWEMHDLLFTASALDGTALQGGAASIGLDVPTWQACTLGPDAASRVAADVALATSLGVGGTPTFAVNGVPVVGAVPESDLRAAIDRARDAAIASGIPRAEYYDRAVLGQ